MKRYIYFVLTVFIVLLILSPYCTSVTEEAASKESSITFRLPSSLEIIEDEAFEGTAVKVVVLPDGLLSIGAKAFEKALFLTDVYLPETTEYIADTAFSLTSNLIIHGIDGSYAKDWAQRHTIPFVVDDIWNVFVPRGRPDNIQTTPIYRFIAAIVLIIFFSFFRSCYYELRSRRPQDRPELHALEYRFP